MSQQFVDAIRAARGVLPDLDTALSEVIESVQATGKAGSITLKVDIKPQKGGDNIVLLSGQVSSKVPSPEPQPTTFWITDDLGLSRRDPRQPELPGMRPVDPDTGEIAAEHDDERTA